MKYGLIGGSLKHSFSKEIHEKLAGYEYELKELSEEELGPWLTEGSFDGINVTIPYKKAVIPYLCEISERARRIGAVNTVVNKDGKLCGDNTDYLGLRALVLRVMPDVRGAKVLILGTGGTSLTAKVVCEDLGAEEILRVSRNGNGTDNIISYEDAVKIHNDAELIINSTPVGMFPKIEECPIELSPFTRLKGVVDVVYNPLRTKLILDARSRGISAEGGLFMLVAQAEEASKQFLSVKLNEELTVDEPKNSLESSNLRTAENGQKQTSTKVENVFSELIFERENLVLVGMPGAGKTTIGKLLAKELGREFVDTDQRITEKTGRTPDRIIKEDGEPAFRDIESDVVRELAALTGVVIATGGGAVLRSENVCAMRQNGRIIFIDTPVEKLKATSDRPLSDTADKLRALYGVRKNFYNSAADLVVENTGSPEDACDEILKMEHNPVPLFQKEGEIV